MTTGAKLVESFDKQLQESIVLAFLAFFLKSVKKMDELGLPFDCRIEISGRNDEEVLKHDDVTGM